MTQKKTKTFRVEVVEIKTGKVVSVVGRKLIERQAERRELTLLSRMNREDYFVRSVAE